MTAIERPEPSEHSPYFGAYINLVPDGDLIEAIEQQTEDTLELLDSLTEEQGDLRYAEGKWSIRQVVGHLADTERVFAFRALWVARGATAELPGFDENAWAGMGEHDDRALADVVEEFAAVREATLAFARSVTPEMAVRQSVINGVSTSVRAMLHMVAGHERHHLAILRARYLT